MQKHRCDNHYLLFLVGILRGSFGNKLRQVFQCLYKLEFVALLNFCANGKLIRKIENILFQKQRVEILFV